MLKKQFLPIALGTVFTAGALYVTASELTEGAPTAGGTARVAQDNRATEVLTEPRTFTVPSGTADGVLSFTLPAGTTILREKISQRVDATGNVIGDRIVVVSQTDSAARNVDRIRFQVKADGTTRTRTDLRTDQVLTAPRTISTAQGDVVLPAGTVILREKSDTRLDATGAVVRGRTSVVVQQPNADGTLGPVQRIRSRPGEPAEVEVPQPEQPAAAAGSFAASRSDRSGISGRPGADVSVSRSGTNRPDVTRPNNSGPSRPDIVRPSNAGPDRPDVGRLSNSGRH